MIVVSILRTYRYRCCFFLALFLLWGLFPQVALADGGAPQLAYVSGTAQGISVIDIAQRRVTATFVMHGNPRTVLLSPDGSVLYAAQPMTGEVTVIAAKTGKTICKAAIPGQPSLLALSLDATVLYVGGQGSTGVRALNPANCAVQRTFETHEPVYGLAVAASTAADATPFTPNQLWITGKSSVTVYEANGHLLGTVPVDGGPQYISIPGGFTAYVTTRQGTVVAIDLNTRQVARTLLSGGQFGPMDYNAITGEVFVPDQQHNLLDVLTPIAATINVVPPEPARVIRLNSSPQSIAITSDGQFGFVALANGQVVMLDIPGRSTVAGITVGGTPHFIITGLYPPENNPQSNPSQTTTSPSPATPASSFMLIGLLVLAGVSLSGIFWLSWRYYRQRLARKNNT